MTLYFSRRSASPNHNKPLRIFFFFGCNYIVRVSTSRRCHSKRPGVLLFTQHRLFKSQCSQVNNPIYIHHLWERRRKSTGVGSSRVTMSESEDVKYLMSFLVHLEQKVLSASRPERRGLLFTTKHYVCFVVSGKQHVQRPGYAKGAR